jgi:hypothetical protein
MKEDKRKQCELVKNREIKLDEMKKLQEDDTTEKERFQGEIKTLLVYSFSFSFLLNYRFLFS